MVFFTFVVCLSLCEIYLRFFEHDRAQTFVRLGDRIYPLSGLADSRHYTFDPKTGYALIPNIHDEKQFITTDQHGFRTTGKAIDPDRESIIFVGDSTVFGWGVRDEAAFPYLLAHQDSLNNFNIINMGVPSYSIGHIVQVLEEKVPLYKPKIVFVAILWPWKPFDGYSSSTAWKKVDFDFYKKTIPSRTQYASYESLKRRLMPKTFFYLRDVYYKIKFKDQIRDNLTRPGIRDFNIPEEDEKKLALEHVRLLKGAAASLEAKGVQVIFYIHPYQYTIFHKDYQTLGKTGREMMRKQLNALYPGDFLKCKFSGEPLFIDGCHMSELGHQQYANYFLGIIHRTLTLHKLEDYGIPLL